MKTKVNDILANLNDNFFVSVIPYLEKKKVISKFKIKEPFSDEEIWQITDIHDNILFAFPCKIISNKKIKILYADCFYFDDFNKEAFRLFYFWLKDKNNFNSFDIQKSLSTYVFTNQNNGIKLPLALWEDNGLLENNLTINHNIDSFPKNLTIKGNLNMENSSLPFLGNGLKVEGNVYARNSQLSVIDDTVEIKGDIFVEDSLLISYPTNLINQIVNSKRMKQVIRDF